MKLQEALDIINNHKENKFRVHFEWKEGIMLRSDWFPDDSWIPTEEEAWTLAKNFAAATEGRTVDLYVINSNHSPVPHYKERMIANR